MPDFDEKPEEGEKPDEKSDDKPEEETSGDDQKA